MKVIVIGANGNSGMRVVRRLKEGGCHEPVAMIRAPEQRAAFDEMGVMTVLYNATPFQLLIVAVVIVAIGHLARRRIKCSDGTLRGGGIASTGLVVGYTLAVDYAYPWFCPADGALSGEEQSFEAVVDREKRTLTSDLENQRVFSYDYVTGLTTDARSSTPIAWTRGLREDGRWDRDGVYGTDGGHIAFLGGNVQFFRSLTGETQLVRPDGTKTSNILEILPSGTRVVGTGPASLNGSVPR